MGTEKRVDYAAAYRQFLNYGNGRSLKEFCDTEVTMTTIAFAVMPPRVFGVNR